MSGRCHVCLKFWLSQLSSTTGVEKLANINCSTTNTYVCMTQDIFSMNKFNF